MSIFSLSFSVEILFSEDFFSPNKVDASKCYAVQVLRHVGQDGIIQRNIAVNALYV